MASARVQRFILGRLLSLPTPLLRALSGGAPVYLAGRTLDPRLQFLSAGAKGQPPMSSLDPETARAGSAAGLVAVSGRPEPGVRIEPISVPTDAGDLKARVYRPADQDPKAPILVYAHMGGGVIGDLDMCEAFCTILARIVRCPVLSVDYRLAPEWRFPAGVDDVLATYRWARDNAARFGAPAGQAAIGGDSMGGNFSAIVAQDLKAAGEPQPALQLLVYPAVDVASETASMGVFGEAWPLSRDTMNWFMGHYMNPGDNPADPRLSPIRAADLSGLAPAVIATAGFDPLVDQGEDYAKRLREAGVAVSYRRYDSLTHAFTAMTGAVPAANAACREIAGLVREAYEAAAA